MATRSVTVGKVANVEPGELAAFDIDGTRIAVANVEGRLFAIDELCTHEQCSLVEEGTLEGSIRRPPHSFACSVEMWAASSLGSTRSMV